MKKVYVRWMGAYAGRQYSLKECLTFEMLRKDEAACEPMSKRNGRLQTGIASLGDVGLLISRDKIFREFRSDCWSYYGTDKQKAYCAKKDQHPSRLYASRPGYKGSDHAEAWAHMDGAVEGIVVCGAVDCLKKERCNAIIKVALRFNLKIFRFDNGVLAEERGWNREE